MKNQPYTPHFYVNNEITAIFDRRPVGTNPFGLRLVPSGSTYGQKMSYRSSGHFGYLPRKSDMEGHFEKFNESFRIDSSSNYPVTFSQKNI